MSLVVPCTHHYRCVGSICAKYSLDLCEVCVAVASNGSELLVLCSLGFHEPGTEVILFRNCPFLRVDIEPVERKTEDRTHLRSSILLVLHPPFKMNVKNNSSPFHTFEEFLVTKLNRKQSSWIVPVVKLRFEKRLVSVTTLRVMIMLPVAVPFISGRHDTCIIAGCLRMAVPSGSGQ